MRYIINDDDIEDWVKRLKEINVNLNDSTIEYVIGQMEYEIEYNVKRIEWELESKKRGIDGTSTDKRRTRRARKSCKGTTGKDSLSETTEQ